MVVVVVVVVMVVVIIVVIVVIILVVIVVTVQIAGGSIVLPHGYSMAVAMVPMMGVEMILKGRSH